MNKIFLSLFYLLICTTLSAENNSDWESIPSPLVDGCVNVISGQYTETEVDIMINGEASVDFKRFYNSGSGENRVLAKGWTHNHFALLMDYHIHVEGMSLKLDLDSHVIKKIVKHKKGQFFPICITQENFAAGLTNVTRGGINGSTNIKNDRLEMRYYKQPLMFMHSADGSKKTFEILRLEPKKESFLHGRVSRQSYPNGNELVYSYPNEYQIGRMDYYSAAKEKIDSVRLRYTNNSCKIDTDSNQWANYEYKIIGGQKYLHKVSAHNKTDVSYDYSAVPGVGHHLLTRKTIGEGNYLEIKYYQEGRNVLKYPNGSEKVVNLGGGHPSIGRVAQLFRPTSHSEKLHPTATFDYEYNKEGGCSVTKVYHANNKISSYTYNNHGHLLKIEHEEDDLQYHGVDIGKPSSAPKKIVQRLFWGKIGARNQGDIIGITIGDDKQIAACKTFKYDNHFNVIEESVYGVITGKNTNVEISINDNGEPSDIFLESYTKKYTFGNPHNKYLLTKEELSPSHYITYSYKDKAPYLLVEKNDFCENGGVLKEQYFYDNNNIIKTIVKKNVPNSVEGGEEYSFSREIVSSHANGSFGMPLELSEYYFDAQCGANKLSKRKCFQYDANGRIVVETIYDGDNNLQYELTNSYDRYGNITHSVDPLGREAVFNYDDFGRKIYERGFKDKHCIEYSYSPIGTLLKRVVVYDDYDKVEEFYEYDVSNHLIAQSDSYGNIFKLSYSSLGKIKSKKDNNYIPPEHYFRIPEHIIDDKSATEYDCMGNVTSAIDSEGNITRVCYNSHNKPLIKTFSDNTKESYRYDILGRLIEKRNITGNLEVYEYDDRDRLIKEEHFGADGRSFYIKKNVYNAFVLLQSIENGIQKNFEYDSKGNVIAEIETDLVTGTELICEFSYDALGRRTLIRKHSERGEYTDFLTVYDSVGRIVKESTQDYLGKLLEEKEYYYDFSDNKTIEVVSAGGSFLTEFFEYNNRNDIIKFIDSQGYKTYYDYDYLYKSRPGLATPRVKKCTMIDSAGVKTITIMNSLNEVESIEKISLSGKTLSYEVNTYNLERQKTAAFHLNSGTKENGLWTIFVWQYGVVGRLEYYEQLSHPFSTFSNRRTTYSYNKVGQLSATVANSNRENAVVIYNEYDPAGRVLLQYDNKTHFAYKFNYDQYNNVIYADDCLNCITVYREYDGHGRIINERLGDRGIEISNVYDNQGRILQQNLPAANGTAVYEYNHLSLKAVTWNGYKHSYDDFGDNKKVTAATMIGNAGIIEYKWDVLGRPIKVDHALWREDMTDGYDAVGNLIVCSTHSEMGDNNNFYQYDELHRLVSETGSYENEYTYDCINNRTSRNKKAYLINPLNELKRAEGYKYIYDSLGNVKYKYNKYSKTNYRYDSLNRLIAIEGPQDSCVEFIYDAFNRRIIQRDMYKDDDYNEWMISKQHYFFYDDQKEIGRCDESLHTKELRILGYGLGAEIGAAVMIAIDEARVYAPIHDHNGNVIALLDSTDGTIAEQYSYDAFGVETIYDDQNEKVERSVIGNPWRFSSKRVDEDTGLVYFGRRYYSPEIGRWLSVDPKGQIDGPNLYTYLLNAPLTHLDLYGEWSFKAAFKLIVRFFLEAIAYIQASTSNCAVTVGKGVGDNFPGLMIEGTGNKLAGNNFYSREEHHYTEYNSKMQYESQDNFKVLYSNGIQNDIRDFEFGTNMLAGNLQHSVLGMYNPSRTLITDLTESGAYMLHYKSEAVKGGVHQIKTSLDKMDRLGEPGKGRIIYCAFSQGTQVANEVIRSLPYEYSKRIHVITCGGMYISEDRVASSVSYVCMGDPVPIAVDSAGIGKKLLFNTTSNIVAVKPDSVKDLLMAHRWANPAYQKAVQTRYLQIINGEI